MLDGLGNFLLAKVVTTKIEMRAFIIWISSDELIEILFLLRRIPVGAGFGAQDQQPLAI